MIATDSRSQFSKRLPEPSSRTEERLGRIDPKASAHGSFNHSQAGLFCRVSRKGSANGSGSGEDDAAFEGDNVAELGVVFHKVNLTYVWLH